MAQSVEESEKKRLKFNLFNFKLIILCSSAKVVRDFSLISALIALMKLPSSLVSECGQQTSRVA
jgi:hypothetical protein